MPWSAVNGKSGLSVSANYCKQNTLKKFFLSVISGFRCEIDKNGIFWVITQRMVVVTDVSGQTIDPKFKG
jgi:hypothetical protein